MVHDDFRLSLMHENKLCIIIVRIACARSSRAKLTLAFERRLSRLDGPQLHKMFVADDDPRIGCVFDVIIYIHNVQLTQLLYYEIVH